MVIKYNNNFDGTIPFSDLAIRMHLTANTELTYTLPGNETQNYRVLFDYGSSTSNVYVGYNSTAAVPAANATDITGRVESKPQIRYAVGGDILHFVTPDANAYIGFAFMSLPSGK